MAESQARQEAARQASAGKDTATCVQDVIASCTGGDHGDCRSCSDQLRGCLSAVSPDPQYCTDVPGFDAEPGTPSSAWRRTQRQNMGQSHWACAAMFKFVQLHCHPP